MLDILVVDDEPGFRDGIAFALSDAGHKVTEACDGVEALQQVSQHFFDVLFCDVRLPKIDGLSLFRRVHHESPSTAVILMTAFGRVADAKLALRDGAYDYLTKPFGIDVLLDLTQRIEEQRQLSRAGDEVRARVGEAAVVIGRSPPMIKLLDRLDTLSQSAAPVLLTGESGVGKELIARVLHQRSPRHAKPFVAINCAALPETLFEAELFGHERGAFTGAIRKRDGRFRVADGGTMLLDEVAEISLSAQTKLLRVLQEGTIEPVGSNTSISVDVRVISATHQDLKERVASGRFREDLYYRLNVLDLRVPALRERTGDLPLLLHYFLGKFTVEGQQPPTISNRAWRALSAYGYPGNVREFAHAIERAVVLCRGAEIELEHLPTEVLGQEPPPPATETMLRPLAQALREFERNYLQQALELTQGKRGRAAELLGISRKNLWEKLRLHNLGGSDDEKSDAAAPDSDEDK